MACYRVRKSPDKLELILSVSSPETLYIQGSKFESHPRKVMILDTYLCGRPEAGLRPFTSSGAAALHAASAAVFAVVRRRTQLAEPRPGTSCSFLFWALF
eukprot:1130018-Pleurochrysis_carterae.AAC.1